VSVNANCGTAGGDWWTDEYNVKPIGVLECPTVLIESEELVSEEGEEGVKAEGEWVVVE
jgi:hypothetical protein